MLGGTGPLSDAGLAKELVQQAQEAGQDLKHFSAVIYSFPPPRGVRDIAVDIIGYVSSMSTYSAKYPAKVNILCSNTAHMHISEARTFMSTARHNVVNMVRVIAREIALETLPALISEKNVLVLGTTQAAKGRLYPNYFDRFGVSSILPESKQETIQHLIDETKAGRALEGSPINTTQQLVDLFVELARKTKPSHMLLSCTEIPLALHQERPEGDGTYLKHLKERLHEKLGYEPLIVDTEIQMAKNATSLIERGRKPEIQETIDKLLTKIAKTKWRHRFNDRREGIESKKYLPGATCYVSRTAYTLHQVLTNPSLEPLERLLKSELILGKKNRQSAHKQRCI